MASDATILEEALERHTVAKDEWADIRREGTRDMRVLTGGIWEALDPKGTKQRKDANRPMIAPDELGQYINQVVNEVRANPRSMKYAPSGNGANDKGARFYENKFREIEYRSHAKLANTIAFENAVQRGYGFARVSTKYVHSQVFDPTQPPDASFFDQDIWIEGFPDPDQVLPDPFALSDLSDQTYAFVFQWLPVTQFKRKYGRDAKVVNFTADNTSRARDWFSPNLKQVLTAEYWDKACTGTRTLLLLKPQTQHEPPRAIYRDQINPDALKSEEVLAERDVDMYAVTQYITNGIEVLQTKKWAGKYIPIAGCFGKVFFLDDGEGAKRVLMSMTRLARDPFLLYAYIRTCQVELVGITPKFPYFYAKGSLSPQALNDIVRSVSEPVAAIEVETTIEGKDIPFPQRNPYDAAPIQSLEMLAEAARRGIQAAMGISPLPTTAQRHNEKSGKALQQIEESGQRGSYHFRDHYEDMLRLEGVIVEDLLDKVIDTTRETGIRAADGTASIVSVNDPANPDAISTKGDYQGTVSTGPSFDSEREAASTFVDVLVTSPLMGAFPPPVRNKIIALGVRAKNAGELVDQIADIIDPKPQGPIDPKQAAQQLQILQQQLQEVTQAAQKMSEDLKTDQVKVKAQFDIESMKMDKQGTLQIRLQEMKDAATIEVAKIAARAKGVVSLGEAQDEQIAIGQQALADAALQDREHAHDAAMLRMQHEASLQQGDQGHQQALEQGQQGQDHSLEQMAAQPPPPEPEGVGA